MLPHNNYRISVNCGTDQANTFVALPATKSRVYYHSISKELHISTVKVGKIQNIHNHKNVDIEPCHFGHIESSGPGAGTHHQQIGLLIILRQQIPFEVDQFSKYTIVLNKYWNKRQCNIIIRVRHQMVRMWCRISHAIFHQWAHRTQIVKFTHFDHCYRWYKRWNVPLKMTLNYWVNYLLNIMMWDTRNLRSYWWWAKFSIQYSAMQPQKWSPTDSDRDSETFSRM